MSLDPSLLQIHTHDQAGFKPLVDFEHWRVAVLNFTEDLRPENLQNMQRHNETDEVFVLLHGRCLLFIAEGQDEVGVLHAVNLEPLKVYNVKRGTWHNHTLSKDASVLVVENRDTTFENSPFCGLSQEQRGWIAKETRRVMGQP